MKNKSEERQRRQALEAVFAIATSFEQSLQSIFDRVVMSIASILEPRSIALYRLADNKADLLVRYDGEELKHSKEMSCPCPACASVLETHMPYRYTGDLNDGFHDCFSLKGRTRSSFIAIPILDNEAHSAGMICLLSKEGREFRGKEMHVLEIFARYVFYEISRRKAEELMLQSRQMHLLAQLTSGVAHEVRNPLNAIMAISEALFKKMDNREMYGQYMEHIRNQIKRLSRLMESLLALGRPLRSESCARMNIAQMLRDSVADWEHVVSERQITVSLGIPCEMENVSMNADRMKMRQTVINILDNAEQHMLPGEGVTIMASKEMNSVVIRFRDTGSGIAQEDMCHVFEPFFTTRKSGTGLGLSIVKNTIENYGGDVRIYNNDPPPGLTVEISFPVSEPR